MLRELTDHAFAPAGPVHRILGQHRPIQAQIARNFAAFILEHRYSNQTTVSLNEQHGGIGKTAAYAIVLMLDIALTGERAAYATFTRGLRNSIKRQEVQFNEIVTETMVANGLEPRGVTIVEVVSPTSIVSPSKCEAIRKRLANHRIPAADVTDVQDFLDCFDQTERPCEFADLYTVIPNLPCDWTELSLALSPQDHNSEDWQNIQDNRLDATKPRTLILLTHAMVIRTNLRSGTLFDESDRAEHDIFGVKTLVIDEADKLPSVANTALRFAVSRSELLLLAEEIAALDPRADPVAFNDFLHLQAGLDELKDALVRVDVAYTKTDIAVISLIEAVSMINESFYRLMLLASRTDPLIAERLRLCRDNLRVIARMADFPQPILRVALTRDPTGEPDVTLTLEISGGRSLMNQMWRGEGHEFETISMVSAVLTNMPPHAARYDRFRRDIGLDHSRGDRYVETPPLHPEYGQIGSVFVADRVTDLLPTDPNEADLLRKTALNGLAKQITTAASRRREHERMVVLFQSHVAMQAVMTRLPLAIRERIITRNRRHLSLAIEQFVACPYGIWFGVEWEGINFVDPVTHNTMVHALVITRMPLAPRDDIRAMRLGDLWQQHQAGQAVALSEAVHAAYRKACKGLWMGIRSAQDVIDELWILDPRWPVPTYVYQSRPPLIIRALNGRLFSQFDRIIEPYDVPRWYKVDAEGEIETLFEA